MGCRTTEAMACNVDATVIALVRDGGFKPLNDGGSQCLVVIGEAPGRYVGNSVDFSIGAFKRNHQLLLVSNQVFCDKRMGIIDGNFTKIE